MSFTQMSTAIANESDCGFLTFQTLNGHEKPQRGNDYRTAEYFPALVVCCEEKRKKETLSLYYTNAYQSRKGTL
jgi:hypothetical protein